MKVATWITNISFSKTKNLYPVYLKNHVTHHPWHQLDSGMVKINLDFMSNLHSKWFFQYIFKNVNHEYWFWEIIENLDNSTDDCNGYVQKIMIMQVIQQILCEMLIGGRKIVNSGVFFSVANIRTNFQNDSSKFEGLRHEMVSEKPFINQ